MKKRQTPKRGRKKGRNADTRSKYDEQPKREKRREKTAEKECQIEVPIAFVSLAVDWREEDDATWWTWRRERNLITGFMDLPPPQRIHVIDDTARETDRQDSTTGQNSVNTCRQERHRASVEVKQRIRGVHDFLLRIDWIEWHEIPWPGITRHINNCAVVGRTWSNLIIIIIGGWGGKAQSMVTKAS